MSLTAPTTDNPAGPKLFTREKAEAALVLVRGIVADIVDRHDDIVKLRREMGRVEMGLSNAKVGHLQDDFTRHMDRLKELIRELDDVGIDLIDFELGIVSFPTVTGEGDRVWVWSLNQPESLHLLRHGETHKVYKRRARRKKAPKPGS